MSILSNDRFLVQRSGQSYRVDASAVATLAGDTLQSATDRGSHTTNNVGIGNIPGNANLNFRANGRIGIGKDDPQVELDIVGKARSTQTVSGDDPTTLVTKSYVDLATTLQTVTDSGSHTTNSITLGSDSDNPSITLSSSGSATFEGDVQPLTDGGCNLGSTSKRFANVYTQDMHFSNEGTEGNSIDGTTGDWTLQEGEQNLYFINNKTGMKFRVVMEEV